MREIKDGAIFIGDAHENMDKRGFLEFIKLLDSGKVELPPQIFLLGDIFDFLSDTTYAKRFYAEWIATLNSLSKKCEILYFEGNHDFNLSAIFPDISVFSLSAQPQIFTIKDEQISIAHGDIFLNPLTQTALKLLRNRFFVNFMNIIDNLCKFAISKAILKSQAKKSLSYKISNFSELSAARLGNYRTDMILEGHYHQGVQLELNSKIYINLPCFACERSYFIVKYN